MRLTIGMTLTLTHPPSHPHAHPQASPWNILFSCAEVYFSQDNYSTNEEDLKNRKQNKHT